MHHPPLPLGPGLSLPVAVGALLCPQEPLRPRLNRHLGRRVEPLAGVQYPPHPSQAPSHPGSRRSGPDVGNPEMLEFALSQEMARTAPLLPPVEGHEENLLFHFVSVPPLVQGPAVPTFSKKEQFPFPLGSQVHGTTVCDALLPHSRPRPILPVVKRVRFRDDIPPHAPLASPVWDPGSSVRMPQNATPSVPSTPTPYRCTSTVMSIVPLEPLAQCLEAWLTLPSLSRWLTRTIDSATRFSSSLEPGFTQAPIQDADAQAHDQMHSTPLVCSDRPEGCLFSHYNPSTTQNVPTVCVRRFGMAVQGPPLRALPVSPCVHEGHRRCPYPVTGSRHQDPQLPRRLAYPSPIQRAVERSQGLGVSAPQPVGASGQLGKEQALPCAENLFSLELDSVSMTARLTKGRAQAVLNWLSSFRGRNVVPLKQFQRLLGHMASAAAVTPLGLLHMRPLQHWLHSRVPRWAWHHGTL